MLTAEARQVSLSSKMYGTYLKQKQQQVAYGVPIQESFLVWHRTRQWDTETHQMVFRGGRH